MPDVPQRLLSLCPSVTETVFRLDLGDRLVARTKFCVHPQPHVGRLPSVGGTKNPKIDRIVALKPDLVLMNEEENRLEDARALEAHGIRVRVDLPKSVDDVVHWLNEVADELGAASAGARLVDSLVRTRDALMVSTDPIRCVYLIWKKPWMAVGVDTYISRLLAEAGLVNAVDSDERYPAVDESLMARVDLVLLSSEPFPFDEGHRAALLESTSLDPRRVRLCDGEALSWHGARTIEGLRGAHRLREDYLAALS